MRNRFLFVNRYFYPDHSASSQILSDLAFHLAGRNERVLVIASRQSYDDPSIVLPARETVSGVEILRVSTSHFGRHSTLGRLADYLSFYAGSAWTLYRQAKREDVVVVKTDPPLLSVLAAMVADARGFKLVNWLQDLYPEVAQQLGVAGVNGFFGQWLAGLRNRSLRRAAMNVVIDADMATRLQGFGVEAGQLAIVRNWTDDDQIAPGDARENPLRREWGLEGKFVVAYSGNLGRAHDYETALAAAELLRSRGDIVFLFIGGGKGSASLAAEVKRRGLTNFVFQPYQLRERLSLSLGVADVHWLSLKPALRGLIFPSKFYGIAAAGRPMIFVGPSEGELSESLARHTCGLTVAPGQGAELANVIVSLAADPARCRRLGESARLMLDAGLTKRDALLGWDAVLLRVAGSQGVI